MAAFVKRTRSKKKFISADGEKNVILSVRVPVTMSESIDLAVEALDTDQSKFIRQSIRAALEGALSKEVAC